MFIIQDLHSVTDSITNLVCDGKTHSLSAIYKKIRNSSKVSYIGNYCLLSFILSCAFVFDKSWSRSQILRAIHCADFYVDEDRQQAYIPHQWLKYVKNG